MEVMIRQTAIVYCVTRNFCIVAVMVTALKSAGTVALRVCYMLAPYAPPRRAAMAAARTSRRVTYQGFLFIIMRFFGLKREVHDAHVRRSPHAFGNLNDFSK